MKLSELIIDYRKRMNISQREFSRRCDLSNTYISFLEKEKNPKTGKPMVPTLEQYKKIADCMGLTVQQLFEQLDEDAPVDLGPSASVAPVLDQIIHTSEALIIAKGIDKMPPTQRMAIVTMLNGLYPGLFEMESN